MKSNIVKLSKQTIDAIFDKANDPYEAVLLLYKKVIPGIDGVEKLCGWPTVTSETSRYIGERFIHNEKFGRTLQSGMIWMNYGFSTLEANNLQVKDWQADISTCQLKFKEVV
jgi:hypothetical protein